MTSTDEFKEFKGSDLLILSLSAPPSFPVTAYPARSVLHHTGIVPSPSACASCGRRRVPSSPDWGPSGPVVSKRRDSPDGRVPFLSLHYLAASGADLRRLVPRGHHEH